MACIHSSRSAVLFVCALACASSSNEPLGPASVTSATDAGGTTDVHGTTTSGSEPSGPPLTSTSGSPEPATGDATSTDGGAASTVSDESGGADMVAADAFGIRKIYGDGEPVCDEPECVRYAGLDGRDIHDDIENLPSYDGEGDNSLVELGDDVWGVALDWSGEGTMQARLELWSIDEHPWLAMEVTAVVAVIENHGDAAIQPFVYGGRHSSVSDAVRCYGGAYKPKFRLNGDVTIQKELCHSEYSDAHGAVPGAWDFAEERWYAFKTVAYPVDQGVHIEMYSLTNDLGVAATPALPAPAEQEWIMLTSATDDGWMIGNDVCEDACGTVDGTIFSDGNPVDMQESNIPHTNANVGSLRLDDVRAQMWGFSVRRVDPAQPLLP